MSARQSRARTVRRLFWTVLIVVGLYAGLGRTGLLVTGLFFLLLVLRWLRRKFRFWRLVQGTVTKHRSTLALRRRQLTYADAYGNLIEDDWYREREYFAQRTIWPKL